MDQRGPAEALQKLKSAAVEQLLGPYVTIGRESSHQQKKENGTHESHGSYREARG